VVGVLVGPLLVLCAFEFVGRPDDRGWKLAESLTPIAYMWSIWLIAVGIALIV
jgi:hypothetical protein